MAAIAPEYDPVRDVLAKAPEERLEYALDLIRFYHPNINDAEVVFWMHTLKVPLRLAKVMCTLARFKSVMVSFETLGWVMRGHNDDKDRENVAVAMTYLRKALPKGVTIKSHWALGYSLEDPYKSLPVYEGQSVPVRPPIKPSQPSWTPQDDMILDLIYRRGKESSVAALVLGRSCRSIVDRVQKLNQTQPDRFVGWT